jgi:hypothetical protein
MRWWSVTTTPRRTSSSSMNRQRIGADRAIAELTAGRP